MTVRQYNFVRRHMLGLFIHWNLFIFHSLLTEFFGFKSLLMIKFLVYWFCNFHEHEVCFLGVYLRSSHWKQRGAPHPSHHQRSLSGKALPEIAAFQDLGMRNRDTQQIWLGRVGIIYKLCLILMKFVETMFVGYLFFDSKSWCCFISIWDCIYGTICNMQT